MQDDVMFLLRSRMRREILRNLRGQLSPLMLAKLLDRPRPSVSRSLQEMEKRGLVRCTNPKADRWRMYEISEKGKKALKEAEKFT